MYNEEIKQSYIIEKESITCLDKGSLRRWFENTSIFEERLEKDVCNFTFYEIEEMYKTLNLNSYDVLNNLNSQLAMYTDWCLQRALVTDSQNHFRETKGILISCINKVYNDKRIVTREQILGWTKQMSNPSDAFIFLALFEGIKGRQYVELVKLKITDFHDGKVELCTGREIFVSNELYNFALESSKTFEYNPILGGKNSKFSENENPDIIIKNYYNTTSWSDKAAAERLSKRINRICNQLKIEQYMKGNALHESGQIAFIRERCKNLGISAKDYLKEYIEEIENQFGKKINRPSMFYDKYKEYLV